jgi:hypothetical protein
MLCSLMVGPYRNTKMSKVKKMIKAIADASFFRSPLDFPELAAHYIPLMDETVSDTVLPLPMPLRDKTNNKPAKGHDCSNNGNYAP